MFCLPSGDLPPTSGRSPVGRKADRRPRYLFATRPKFRENVGYLSTLPNHIIDQFISTLNDWHIIFQQYPINVVRDKVKQGNLKAAMWE